VTATGYTGGDPSKLDIDGYVKGDVIAANTSGVLTAIPVGTDTEVLTADSSDAEGVDWAAGGGGGGGTPSNTVVTETTFGQASTAGAATAYSRGDHTHGTPASPSVPAAASTVVSETTFGQSPAVGADTIYARQDHTHGTPTSPTVPSASASVVTETSFGQASAVGAAATFSRGDHTHGTPASPSVPSASASVVTETTFGQASAVGAAATFSRGDHTHGTPASPSVPVAGNTVVAATTFGLSATAGVDADFSREDHSHGTPATPAPDQLDAKAAIYGLDLAVLGPFEMGSAAISISAGTLILNRVWVPSAMALTHLGTWIRAAGVTTSGVNGMAVYSAAGSLLEQTVSMDTQFALVDQYVEAALLTTVNLTANTSVYLAILTHFSGSNPSVSGKVVGTNLWPMNGFRPSVFVAGQATFPASVTIGSATVNDAAYCLFAR
jgi:hypothetical protein